MLRLNEQKIWEVIAKLKESGEAQPKGLLQN
jgi:hypothetical protein